MIKSNQLEDYVKYLDQHFPGIPSKKSRIFELNMPSNLLGPYLDMVCESLSKCYPDSGFWYSVYPLPSRIEGLDPKPYQVRILAFGDDAAQIPNDFYISDLNMFEDLYFA